VYEFDVWEWWFMPCKVSGSSVETCCMQVKEVPAQAAEWANDFAEHQQRATDPEFEDIWKHYGEVCADLAVTRSCY
jgi:histone H3/H4